ncbi:MAG: PKD domain-containing protein, partial [Thermoplasmata archaeon]
MGSILRKGIVICIVLILGATIFAGLPMNVAVAGDGTLENPYQITDVWELQAIKDDLDAHYILMNDIDASDTVNWNSGAGFQPIGDDFAQFRGTFDGNNYKITGLFINRPSTNNIGLFGRAYIAEIKNVGLKDVQITGGNAVGSVIGFNYGTPISNAYATGTVSGQFGVGGLIGYNDNGVIEYSYSTCSVSGTWWYTGGLVGYSLGGYGISCYWDTQTSGQAYSAMGTGKTTVQMKAQATFVGWDFTNTWGIDEGVTYPYFIHPPVADAGSDQTVMVEETVYLDGSGSYDVDGTIESYIWDFGDTNSGSGETTTHAYTAVGIYTVTLTVTDNGGATDTDT